MGSNLVLVDLTRAYAGTEEDLAQRAVQATVDPKLVVVGLEVQQSALAGMDSTFVITDGYDANVQQAVADALANHGRDADSITVYSFNPAIYSGRSPAMQGLEPAPKFLPGNRLVAPGRGDETNGKKGEDRFAWPDQLLPLPDALDLLQEVLQERGAATKPVLKTDIRPRLKDKSQAFDSESGLPGARTPTLMSRLLHHAEQAGIVEQHGVDPAVSVRLLREKRESAPKSGRAVGTDETRSEQFQTILLNGIGLFPDVRERLLDNIDQLHAAQAARVTAGQVIKQAVKKTKDESPDVFPRKNKDDLPKEKFPWRKVEGFALLILSRAGLIVDAEGNRSDSRSPWGIRSGFLATFPSEWKTLIDAELILELVVARAGVSWNDGVDLAGALWCNRDEEYVQRVDLAIEQLFESKRVAMSAGTNELEPLDHPGRHRQPLSVS